MSIAVFNEVPKERTTPMKIAVYGAGAIGGHLAMRLHKGGAQVAMIARGAHLAALRQNGLMVEAADGYFHAWIDATDSPGALGPQDAVFVTVKAPALPSVAAGIRPLLGPDTPVVFVMNGIPWWYFLKLKGPHQDKPLPRIDPGDFLRNAIGPDRVIGGVVYSASEVREPGVIAVEQPKSRFILGEIDETPSERVAKLARALGASPTSNHEGRVTSQSSMSHKPSILQDLELGRPMEVDGMFDAPLALARLAGVTTPTLDLMVALAKLRAEGAGLYKR